MNRYIANDLKRLALKTSRILGLPKVFRRTNTYRKKQMFFEFDVEFYREKYLDGDDGFTKSDAYNHYIANVRKFRNDPNDGFSEEWYLARYADVRDAVERNEIPCGFYHYVVSGRYERRLPQYNLSGALEIALPGVTAPSLRYSIPDIEWRTRTLNLSISKTAPKSFWIVMPHLNPDISFGGYRAFFEFIRAIKIYLRPLNYTFRVITTSEERASKEYFQWRTRGKADFDIFEDIEVKSISERRRIVVSSRDRVVAYSTWDALVATQIANLTDEPKLIAFHQEFEPVFHGFGSYFALTASAFNLPSYPIFNSNELTHYFKQHKLSVFGKTESAVQNRDYAVFGHVINQSPLATVEELSSRTTRVCAIYARPEGHAARNLYEFIEIALKRVCAAKKFGPDWRFVGLGCLTALPPISLGGGHELEFVQKMPEGEYFKFLQSIDIGISLMYAPHPSVVPFEFCTTGALVVTNTFENRSVDFFREISSNFISCAPTIDGIVAAIEAAILRVENFDDRVAAAYRPAHKTWPEIFDNTFMKQTIEQLFKTDS